MTTAQEYFYGVGKRKSAIARAKLVAGAGEVIVNGMPLAQYFGGERFTTYINEPLESTGTRSTFTAMVNVRGGGLSGQAGAVRHAISRAVLASKEEFRRPLRAGGLLTRDARVKERKKYGLKRARKAPQYTKR